jgi:hypothetical protein
MKRFLPLSLLMILSIGVMVFLACSDDKGTNSEPDFSAMKDDVEGYMSTIMGSIIFGFDQFEEFDTNYVNLGGGGFNKLVAPFMPADTAYYNYTNGWHEFVMELSATIGDTMVEFRITDSVQYKADDVVMQFPNETTDFLHFIFLLDMMIDDQSNLIDFVYHIDNQYQVLAGGNVEVNGLIDFDIESVKEEESGTIDYDLEIDELVVDGDNGCPLSGTITADVEVDYEGPDASLNGSWTVIITFEDSDTWTIRLEIGDDYWQGTEDFDCGDFNVNVAK